MLHVYLVIIIFIIQITSSCKVRINVSVICLTKIKHTTSDQIKTESRFWFRHLDITHHDLNSMYVTLMAFDTILMECYITEEKGMKGRLQKSVVCQII